jgi:hypothetical protein
VVDAVTYILNANTIIQGLIGKNSADDKWKIYPVIAPQSEIAPYITVRILARPRMGKGCNWNYQLQVVAHANSYDKVKEINEAIIIALESQVSQIVNNVEIGYINFMTESDDYLREHNLFVKISVFEGSGEPL